MKTYSASMFVSLLTSDHEQQNNLNEHCRRPAELVQSNDESNTINANENLLETNQNQIQSNEDQRETWTNNCDYLITTLGGLIGLGL